MIRLFVNQVFVYKSFFIQELWEYVCNNPDLEYQIIKDGEVLSNQDFCRLYLCESKDYDSYIKLENILNQKTTVNAYIQKLR